MTPTALANRIAALDWSATSLQHQLAVTAAVETLRKALPAAMDNVREAWSGFQMVREAVETLGPIGALPASEHLSGPTFMHEAEALVAGIAKMTAVKPLHDAAECSERDRIDSEWAAAVSNVTPLRAPSVELLRGAEYNERHVTLTTLSGAPVANALLARSDRWDWIAETVAEQVGCDVEHVDAVDDTVTVRGEAVFLLC